MFSIAFCPSTFTSCLTNKKQTFAILHAAHVYATFFLFLYATLHVTPFIQSQTTEPLRPSSSILVTYQPIPHSSVCQCLDSIPLLFFSKPHYASCSLCSKPHTHFLFSLILLLSGDVSLNPGLRTASPRPTDNLNIYCQNIRSATVINDSINKPELIQHAILDNNIDFLFLTETWLAPDCPPSIINSLTPASYSFLHTPRPTGRGGGTAVIFKSKFSVTSVD